MVPDALEDLEHVAEHLETAGAGSQQGGEEVKRKADKHSFVDVSRSAMCVCVYCNYRTMCWRLATKSNDNGGESC